MQTVPLRAFVCFVLYGLYYSYKINLKKKKLLVLNIAFLHKNLRQEHMAASSQPALLCAFVELAWNLFSLHSFVMHLRPFCLFSVLECSQFFFNN